MGILLKASEFLKASYLAKTLSLSEPENVDRMLMVARYGYKAGAIGDTITWLQSVEKKCAHESSLHYMLAQCHAALGDIERAKASLKTAFEINEDLRLEALDDPAFESLFG